jgi:hypothetical protein
VRLCLRYAEDTPRYDPELTGATNTDAVPKKRGPKTDVLEALLKRVDGLEAKFKEKKKTSEKVASTLEATPSLLTDDPSSPVQPSEDHVLTPRPLPVDIPDDNETAEATAYLSSSSR